MKNLALITLSVLALTGCSAVQDRAEMAAQQAQDRVQAEVDRKATELKQQATDTANQMVDNAKVAAVEAVRQDLKGKLESARALGAPPETINNLQRQLDQIDAKKLVADTEQEMAKRVAQAQQLKENADKTAAEVRAELAKHDATFKRLQTQAAEATKRLEAAGAALQGR